MTTYRAPQRDMRFVLHELLEVEKLAGLPGYEDASADVIDQVIEEGARLCENVLFPLNRDRRRGGLRLRERRRAHARGLQGGLRRVHRRRLDRARGRRRVRRPGPAQGHQVRGRRDGLLGQPGVRQLSGPLGRRLSRDRDPCERRAQGALSAEARRGPLERHDVPDRAPVRHRPRPDPHPRRAGRRRQLPDHRHQDLHLLRRARPQPRTSSTWCSRACRTRPRGSAASACSWCRSSCPRRTARRARATASAAPASSTRWASRRRPPA